MGKLTKLLGIGVTASISCFFVGEDLAAQSWECGWFCEACTYPVGTKSGSPEHEYSHRNYWTLCSYGGCNSCPISVDEQVDGVMDVRASIEAATPGDLAQVVARHGTSMLVHRERGFVVIQGGCDGEAPAAIVFVDDAVAEGLEAAGVQTYGQYLAEASRQAADEDNGTFELSGS